MWDKIKDHQKAKTEMDRTLQELGGVRDRLEEEYNKVVENFNILKAQHEAAVENFNVLKAQHEAAALEADDAQEKLKDLMNERQGRLAIREVTRGHPLGRSFILHCRTLLATGGSARSIREQLLLNERFFVSEADHSY